MQKKKEKFLNKIVKKNYETELENMLEAKKYDENAKNLLLSILYKIEDSYKDYQKVKCDTLSKEEYIKELINVLDEKCDNIILKDINNRSSDKSNNYTVSIENKTIECYPIEKELLYSISKINKKENIVKNRLELINDSMTNLINIGSNMEFVEPLRDFNGWSWNIETKDYESIEINLVYQIMRLLIGNRFLVEWIKNREKIIDYLEFFENELESKYTEELAENIVQNIIKIAMLLDAKQSKKRKDKWLKLKEEIDEKYNKITNKKEYVQELTEEKIKLNKKIGQIDTILNDKIKLKEEYKTRNEKLDLNKKIFSIRVLQKIMNEERQELTNKIKECNKKLKPKNYFAVKNDLELKVKLLKGLENEKIENELENTICELEANFLKCFKMKIKKAKTKEELIILLYEFRYYSVIPYSNNKSNFEANKINSQLQETAKLLVQKSIANNVIVNIGTDKQIIELITKIIFSTRIIQLKDVYIQIEKTKEGYFVQVYDENVLDNSYNIKNIKLEFTDNHMNKKIKLLN